MVKKKSFLFFSDIFYFFLPKKTKTRKIESFFLWFETESPEGPEIPYQRASGNQRVLLKYHKYLNKKNVFGKSAHSLFFKGKKNQNNKTKKFRSKRFDRNFFSILFSSINFFFFIPFLFFSMVNSTDFIVYFYNKINHSIKL